MTQHTKREIHDEVVSRLRGDGSRITRAREEIVGELIRAHTPLTIAELASRVTADEASVYRTIERLEGLGLLESISYPQNVTRYALVLEHHHHIVCTRCGYTAHLGCGEEVTPPTHPQFREVDHHTVTYYGLCTTCA